jgi:hypothetical protein
MQTRPIVHEGLVTRDPDGGEVSLSVAVVELGTPVALAEELLAL